MAHMHQYQSDLVSIYIPTKNRLPLLKRSVASVLAQDYQSIELIIVDDASNDGTKEFLKQIMHMHPYVYVYNNPSSGACSARNHAILQSTGKFVTGLDDDDYFSDPQRIRKFVDTFKLFKSDSVALYDSVSILLPTGKISYRRSKEYITYAMLLSSNCIGSQVFAYREAYLDAGLFDPLQPAWQDWHLWLRMAMNGISFYSINSCSYVVDESHSYNRISLKAEGVIRLAAQRFLELAETKSFVTSRQRAAIISNVLAYPSTSFQYSDFVCLLKGLKIKSIYLQFLRKIRKILQDRGFIV